MKRVVKSRFHSLTSQSKFIALYWACDYLSMSGSILTHVSKGAHRSQLISGDKMDACQYEFMEKGVWVSMQGKLIMIVVGAIYHMDSRSVIYCIKSYFLTRVSAFFQSCPLDLADGRFEDLLCHNATYCAPIRHLFNSSSVVMDLYSINKRGYCWFQ